MTQDNVKLRQNTTRWNEWKITHMLLYTWFLNSMVLPIVVTVDDIESMKDIQGKLRMIYAGPDKNMRVFQIECEIKVMVQEDRSIQEYVTGLERLWANYDHFSSMACYKDPEYKRGERDAQRGTMHFLEGLNPTFEKMIAVLLVQARIPLLDEAVAVMIHEKSRIRLHARPSGSLGR